MNFERISPSSNLAKFVEWYWCAESDDPSVRREKIIPDGYPEFIFHYGSPFRICLGNGWSNQGRSLLGGQMKQFFFLENTGLTGIFGITFKPAALTHLFGLEMHRFTDQVVNLGNFFEQTATFENETIHAKSTQERIAVVEEFLKKFIVNNPETHPVDRALGIMRRENGLTSIKDLCDELAVSDRQLQRLFHKYVGLTPKFYARIIRFNGVFKMIKVGKTPWADVVHASGYYDQSHFIRNFKAFTGDDPSAYSFEIPTLTNFFASKSAQ